MHRPKAVARAPVTNQQVLREPDVEQVIGIITWAVVFAVKNDGTDPDARFGNFDPTRNLQLIFVILKCRWNTALKVNKVIQTANVPSTRKNSSRILGHHQDFFDMFKFEI